MIAIPAESLPYGTAIEDLALSLVFAPQGGIDPGEGMDRWEEFPLDVSAGALPPDLAGKWPHLAHCHPAHLPGMSAERAAELLTGQTAVVGRLAPEGETVWATSLQIPGVIDEIYAEAAKVPFGLTWEGVTPTLRLWAPTAHTVELLLWAARPPEGDARRPWMPPLTEDPHVIPMLRDDATGVWSVEGEPAWEGRCYRYRLRHVLPSVGRPETVTVTDPWSVALTIDSTHSVIVDLDDLQWAPEIWKRTPNPAGIRPVDHTIYELHIRDYSRDDPRMEESLQGSYRAFAAPGAGREHLVRLAEAGLTTVHLLPSFDISTIPEDRTDRADFPIESIYPTDRVPTAEVLRGLPADSAEQQQRVMATAEHDAFNWGYDPWHFMVPEGSYAATAGSAHGGERVAEFREMVGGLHSLGLRVVLDQVLNHTSDSGLAPASVLDRVVPGYYHRLNAEGRVETTTCCQNLATEHLMGHRLMVDTCVLWARHYRVDGFRFDLMGHHSRANLEGIRAALDQLTLAEHGVDGRAILLYGEGWNFGEVAGNTRFYQAVQGQLHGTEIGTFNDRIRDALRGGSAHDDHPASSQGFATGGSDPRHTDLLQVSLAGGLQHLELLSQATGELQRGRELPYGWGVAGYAQEPAEVVHYVDAHDNETLWDALTLKLPVETPMEERIARNTLALAAVTWAQGVAFWHAGSEILRSKSLDRNSYNSGDWFNWLDYTYQDNGFARGLPPAGDNQSRWPILAPLLRNPDLLPRPEHIVAARDEALDLLRVRAAHPLLRLGSGTEIRQRVSFPLSGTQRGGADRVLMLIDGHSSPAVEPGVSALMVVLNGAQTSLDLSLPELAGQEWELSPVLMQGANERVKRTTWHIHEGTLSIPALTAAVLLRPSSQQALMTSPVGQS